MYHLHLFLKTPDLAKVTHAIATSRLNYNSNAFVMRWPSEILMKLQSGLDAATRLLTEADYREKQNYLLQQFHWLLVYFLTQWKVVILTHKALNDLGPRYLKYCISTSDV